MSDFRPGDMVECVDTRPTAPRWRGVSSQIAEGQLYVVGRVWFCNLPDVQSWQIAIPGINAKTNSKGFGSHRFRKVYRPKADLIERLTAEPVFPSPRVKEDA